MTGWALDSRVAGAVGGQTAPVIPDADDPAAGAGCDCPTGAGGSGVGAAGRFVATMGGCERKGFASTVGVAAGEVMVVRQCGQGPDTPAIDAGTVRRMPQDWQLNWMTLGAGFMSGGGASSFDQGPRFPVQRNRQKWENGP